jgi:hypothetical protein
MDYEFINKTLFFPKQGILAVGDLHLGYEYALQQSGVVVPERQTKEVIAELDSVFEELGSKIKKIVFLGDIKHSFSYEWKEKSYFNEVLEFLRARLPDKNIILIKGNHDTIDYSFRDKLKDYFIEGDLAFAHGDKTFPEIYDKSIKTLVIGHVHPSVLISDKPGIKREKYKCFLVGEFKGKETIIMPSFLATVEGQTVNEYENAYEDFFSIIPKNSLMNFKVFAIGDEEVLEFGRVKEI